jgi:hypothetical protein
MQRIMGSILNKWRVSRGEAEWKIQEAEVGRLGGCEVDRCRQTVGRGPLRFADQTSADSADPGRPRSSDVNPGKQSLSTGVRNAVLAVDSLLLDSKVQLEPCGL